MRNFVHSEPGSSRLVLDMPHSGVLGLDDPSLLPNVVRNNIRLESDKVRETLGMGVDLAVPAMTDFHNQTDHSRVWTDLPRVALDVNRELTSTDGLAVEGYGPAKHAHGLIWRGTVPHGLDFSRGPQGVHEQAAQAMEDILHRPYTQEELEELLSLGYHPYYSALKESMDRVVEREGAAVMVALHTFPEFAPGKLVEGRFTGAYALGPKVPKGPLQKRQLPDMISIHNAGAAATRPVIEVVRSTFEDAGYMVQDGIGPFKGDMGSTVLYPNLEEGRNVIGLEFVARGIEIDRDQGSLQLSEEGVERVRPVFQELLDRLSGLSVDELRS